jgi:glyoxylase I family protein
MALKLESVCPLLQVFDMPRSVAFYRDRLGFEIVATSQPGNHFDWAFLRLDNAELMLNTAYEADERPSDPDPARMAAHVDTVLYFGCRDVDAAHTFLRAQGLEVEAPVITHYGMKQVHLMDPDGYILCFQWQAD